jgi:hypothetical protein
MLASCPGEGLGDAVGLGEGLGDGLAVGLGLGVACGLGSVGVCHALTVEVFKTNRVRRSMITAAPPRKFIGCKLLFRKLIDLIPSTREIRTLSAPVVTKPFAPLPLRRTTHALPCRRSLQPSCQIENIV